jgi:dTDP-4-dehydrorhamnose reductase
MLGSMVTDVLSRDPDIALSATVRSPRLIEWMRKCLPRVESRLFDGGHAGSEEVVDALSGFDWIINCIGITKPLIKDDSAADVERAIQINAALPHAIASHAARTGARLLQIATDCVYSGAAGSYREDDPHDALDVYGKTKSLGEVRLPGAHHLRCSIVGPEPKDFKFLLEWFRRQPRRARLKGYTNQRWNGVTTLHFGRICRGIIKTAMSVPFLQHVVPGDALSKEELLRVFARWYDRGDIEIEPVEAESAADRTLATAHPDVNIALWQAAGYDRPPSTEEMIREVSRYDCLVGAPA